MTVILKITESVYLSHLLNPLLYRCIWFSQVIDIQIDIHDFSKELRFNLLL